MPPWLFADWSWEQLLDYWPHLCFVALTATISIAASAHTVLTKRDTRTAIAWVGLIWLTPLLGSLLYVWLGINRIRRRVRHLRGYQPHHSPPAAQHVCTDEELAQKLEGRAEHLRKLVRLTGELTGRPLLDGNQVTPLAGAENAYPAMLAAMDGASRSITLSTYIFNNDPTGHMFAEALSRAHHARS